MRFLVCVFVLAALVAAEPPSHRPFRARIVIKGSPRPIEIKEPADLEDNTPYPAAGFKPQKEFKLPSRSEDLKEPSSYQDLPTHEEHNMFKKISIPHLHYGIPEENDSNDEHSENSETKSSNNEVNSSNDVFASQYLSPPSKYGPPKSERVEKKSGNLRKKQNTENSEEKSEKSEQGHGRSDNEFENEETNTEEHSKGSEEKESKQKKENNKNKNEDSRNSSEDNEIEGVENNQNENESKNNERETKSQSKGEKKENDEKEESNKDDSKDNAKPGAPIYIVLQSPPGFTSFPKYAAAPFQDQGQIPPEYKVVPIPRKIDLRNVGYSSYFQQRAIDTPAPYYYQQNPFLPYFGNQWGNQW